MTCRFAASVGFHGADTIYATVSMNKTLQHSFVFLGGWGGSFSNLSVNHLSAISSFFCAVVMSFPVLIMGSSRSRCWDSSCSMLQHLCLQGLVCVYDDHPIIV
jgi:hypothetical protein